MYGYWQHQFRSIFSQYHDFAQQLTDRFTNKLLFFTFWSRLV